MGVHKGSEGTVLVGANAVAEVMSFEFTEEAEILTRKPLGATWQETQSGTKKWSGSITCDWDETDTNGQVALANGATVTLNLHPEGNASGDVYWSGSAVVSNVTRSVGGNDEFTSISFSFTGSGALTEGAVV